MVVSDAQSEPFEARKELSIVSQSREGRKVNATQSRSCQARIAVVIIHLTLNHAGPGHLRALHGCAVSA